MIKMMQINELTPEARNWLTRKAVPLTSEFVITEQSFTIPKGEVAPPTPPPYELPEWWPIAALGGIVFLTGILIWRK